MTSNIGADLIRKGSAIGFMQRIDETKVREANYKQMKDKLLEEVKKKFLPEFLNRIDGIVVFHALNKMHIRSIVELLLKAVSLQLKEKNVTLEVTEAAKDLLGEKGYDEAFGARPLKRTIQDMVVDKLSEAILREGFKKDDTVLVDVQEEQNEAGVIETNIVLRKAPVIEMASVEK
jgi:ATP-dependent Clp protease ATP-binding subunit ClpC